MKNRLLSLFTVPVAVFFLILSVSFCAQESDQQPENSRSRYASAPSSQIADQTGAAADEEAPARAPGEIAQEKDTVQSEGGFFTAVRMKSMLIRPMEKAADRLLEYHVNLEYRCENFQEARAELLNIISKYGFIRSGSTSINGNSRLTLQAGVLTKDLFRFLLDMDRVGRLVSERINVNDLTEQMVLSQRQSKREDIRILRRSRGLTGLTPQAKNWQVIENSIATSEDSLDQAEHGKWQVLDRVNWAAVTVTLRPPGAVQVPPYREALYEIAELVLWLPYAFIYLTPIILMVLLVRWKWSSIAGFFKKKEE